MKNLTINTECLQRKKSTIFMRQKGGLSKYGQGKICFISPRKIAYFKDIDPQYLDEKERTTFISNCQNYNQNQLTKSTIKQAIIDYKQIKKCLSPRSNKFKFKEPSIFDFNGQFSEGNHNASQKTADNIIQNLQKQLIIFTQKIKQLQTSLTQKNTLLQQYQLKIQENTQKILKYEKQLNQHQNVSLRSISTNNSISQSSLLLLQSTKKIIFAQSLTQNIPPLSPPPPPNHILEHYRKIIQKYEQRQKTYKYQLNQYQVHLNKYKIKNDIISKIKFDYKTCQMERNKLLKQNQKYKIEINGLKSKNIYLKRELLMMNDQNVDLVFSPQKRMQNSKRQSDCIF